MKAHSLFTISFIILFVLSWNVALAEENKPAKARMSLSYLNTNGDQRSLTVVVKSKIEKRYQPVEGVAINFYLSDPTESGLMGSVTTDVNGTSVLQLSEKFFLLLDTAYKFTFIAQLVENSKYKAKDVSLDITEVLLDLDFIDQDSIKFLRAIVKEKDSLGTKLPTEEVEIKFLVDRPFSRLPIGGEYNTIDEEGTATLEFPNDLPGDPEGNVTVIIKIEDSDLYGNVERIAVINWGIIVEFDDATTARSLWSAGANAPVALLILVNALIAAVWGMIAYIIVKIFQIRRS